MQADTKAAPGETTGSVGVGVGGSRTLEDYKLGHTLGQGHFATVKLAQRLSTGKMVALKIIEYNAAAARQQEMITRELTAMQSVQHENVLQLERAVMNVPFPRENGDPREVLLLDLELAPGGELFDYILTGGAFPEPVARAYFKQLLLALHECHRVGVYHRDIKPENILLNEQFQLKVGDFGLASLNPDNELLRTTCGTRSYQAPEILARQMYDGGKADVWSAGVVLFIMLAGNPPFKTAARGDWWFNAITLGRYDQFWLAHQRAPAPKIYEEAMEFLNGIFTVSSDARKPVADLLAHSWIEYGSPDYPDAQEYEGVAGAATPLPSGEALAEFMSARKAVIDENNRRQREVARARRQQQREAAAAAEAGAGAGVEAVGNATFNPHQQTVYRSMSMDKKEETGATTGSAARGCSAGEFDFGEAKEAPIETVDHGFNACANLHEARPPLLAEEGVGAFAFYASERPRVLLELLSQATHVPCAPATAFVLASQAKAGAETAGGKLDGKDAERSAGGGSGGAQVDWEEYSLDVVMADHVRMKFQIWRLDSDDDIYCVSALRVDGSPWEFNTAWKETLGTLGSFGCQGATEALELAQGFAALVEPTDLTLAEVKQGGAVEEDISEKFDEKMVM